jgi:hypothetical protein
MVSMIVQGMAQCSSAETAEEQLLQHLSIHWDHLQARGIPEDEIYRDVMGFGAACRSVISAERAVILDRAVAVMINGRRGGRVGVSSMSGTSPVLHVEISLPSAKVLLKRPFRDDAYVRRHVSYVVRMEPGAGERHVQANLESIQRKLEAMRLAPDVIAREMRDTEARVRAELWRQVLLPEDRQ